MRDGTEIPVTAQLTACDQLVVAPAIKKTDDGWELTRHLHLVHSPTRSTIIHDEWPNSLFDLAAQLAEFDWKFTDRDHLTKPENRETFEKIKTVVRAWQSNGFDEPAYFSGDSEELKADRQRDPAGTYLREHLEWWSKHHDGLRSSGLASENLRAYGAEINASVEGYSVIFLLAVLRKVAPQIADMATKELVSDLECGDSLGEWVFRWRDELAKGEPLTLMGIPDPDPLSPFLAQAGRKS